MAQRESTVLKEIEGRRKYITEIIAIAVGLALFINLSSNYIFEWVKGWPIFPRIALTIAPLIVSVTFLLRYVYGKTIEQTEISILLPFIVKTEEIRVEPVKGYSPAFRANTLLSPLGENNELRKELIQDWKNGIATGVLKEYGVFKDSIHDLLISILVSFVRLYGEHTLTTTSLYHKEYRGQAWKFSAYSVKVEDFQNKINKNVFLRTGVLRLPEKVRLYIKHERNVDFRGIRIDSPYCWIEFKILPYWRLITEESGGKSYKIVKRNIKRKDVEVLIIPLRIVNGVKVTRIFSEMLDNYYMWMHGLMLDAFRWLSWEEYERGDFERLVVDINQDLLDIKKAIENKSPR